MQQISICRFGMALGLSTCDTPDQFFSTILTGRDEWTPAGGSGFEGPPIIAKGVVVRGIRFSYQYSYIPSPVPEGDSADGITSIRSALILLPMADGSTQVGDTTETNLLFHSDALSDRGLLLAGSLRSRYRILWRGMDLLHTPLLALGDAGDVPVPQFISMATPRNVTLKQEVLVKVGATVDENHGLFFLTEAVNPFLTSNPTIGLDLFGVAAVKPMMRGNRYK